MTVATNTIQAVARIGIREDLSDRIGELFPDDCPFQKAIGSENASQVYHEWQTDKLAAASATNKHVQGMDLVNDSRANTVRQGNYSQIMAKVVGSSTTMEASKTAGRASELGRELMKAGRELKTDAELRFTGGLPAVPPTASVEGESAGALCFMTTNSYLGTAGSPTQPTYSGGTTVGYPNAAAGNGTQRTYTETLLKTALADIWKAGGNPKLVITDVGHKQIAAAFAGLSAQRRETNDKRITIVAGADFYVSDVGEVQFVPSRFCSARDVLIIDPDFWAVATLDALKIGDLAKTGLATRKEMHVEHTLVCRNEAASAVIRDLT
jgi:hypothetical protein